MGLQSLNYDFLSDHDPILVEYGALAERCFVDDPSTCIIKLRQMAEMLAELAASYAGLHTPAEILAATNLDRDLWPLNRPALTNHPNITITGRKRGTRYAWRD